MKKFAFIIFLFLAQGSIAQELNSYKYVIVPLEYDFLKEPNQFQLAELTKFLFEKEGFQAYVEGDLPDTINRRSCEILNVDIDENSGLFITRLTIVLKDCNDKIIFTTEQGSSREKDYTKAYHEALREAFKSIAAQDYEYHQEKERTVEVTAIPTQVDSNVKGEVVNSTPEPKEEKQASKASAEDKLEKELVFVRDNGIYYLEKSSSGYNFYQKGMAEPFASLVKSSTGDTYIYSSITSKGMASFSSTGDLIVEVLDAGSGTVKTTIYRKQG